MERLLELVPLSANPSEAHGPNTKFKILFCGVIGGYIRFNLTPYCLGTLKSYAHD